MRALLFATFAVLLAGCDTTPPAANSGEAAAPNEIAPAGNAVAPVGNETIVAGGTASGAFERDAWVGRWTGVEGTMLVVSKADAPGRYRLEMQYTLDDKGSFDGTATAEGIAFTRPDGPQLLRATDGDATGLKYLAGKQDCLTVKDGEGYCRD